VLRSQALQEGGANPLDPLNIEAAKEMLERPAQFAEKARKWTQLYARPEGISAEQRATSA
jgi:ubiquitin-protein ligase